ncbi:glycoside hydrolase [bacterium]|nr:MAG: glycoside hydrolase [bacterium]
MATANTGKKRVIFFLKANPGDEVCVAGTFNNWDATACRLEDSDDTGNFKRSMFLPQGRHEYKFVVNGVWCMDTGCAEWTSNGMGTLNSVLNV